MGTWHRGTPVQLGGLRRSGHFCFRTAEGAPTAKAIHQLSSDATVPEFSNHTSSPYHTSIFGDRSDGLFVFSGELSVE